MATTNATGTITATMSTGPFGEPITGQTNPNNTVAGTTYNYVGQHEKLTETGFALSVVQMGARLYVPSMGRFLQVDPIEGGVDNNYVYPGDPVNDFDLEGTWSVKKAFSSVAKVASVASYIPGPIGMVAGGVAAASYAAAGDRKAAVAAAAGIALSAVGAKAAYGAYKGARAFGKGTSLLAHQGGYVRLPGGGHSPAEYAAQAAKMGYRRTSQVSHGKPVFQKGRIAISPDRTRHNVDGWKMFKNNKRVGTYTFDLKKRIKW